jgi:hypothetical protein
MAAGIGFAMLAGEAAGDRMRIAWRLAAWLVSGIAFAAHLIYESTQYGGSAPAAALHVALGVALGALGLAAGAIAHALTSGSGNLRLLGIALLAWPLLTALPAFLVALALAALIRRMKRTP